MADNSNCIKTAYFADLPAFFFLLTDLDLPREPRVVSCCLAWRQLHQKNRALCRGSRCGRECLCLIRLLKENPRLPGPAQPCGPNRSPLAWRRDSRLHYFFRRAAGEPHRPPAVPNCVGSFPGTPIVAVEVFAVPTLLPDSFSKAC
jgi:hypothetical protein